jgi:hypothetical protein
MVEFQTAREYEGYENYPNFLARAYQADLQEFGNFSNFKGVWLWTGYAGWYKGANISYGFHGFYAWQDANVYAYSRLNWNYSEDVTEITRDWVRLTLGVDNQLIANFTQMLLLSELAVRLGLYIYNFANYTLGLNTPFFSIGRLPTMLWVYWGIPTSSHAVLSVVYGRCRENLSANVRDGFIALAIVENMSALIQGFEMNVTSLGVYSKMLFSLEYMKKVYTMLAWYRQLFLCYYDYTTTLNETSKQLYLAALPEVKAAIADYKTNWDLYQNFSRYETHEMEEFIHRVETNYPSVSTTSRLFFPILLGFFIIGIVMSHFYNKSGNRKSSKYLDVIIKGSIAFQESILSPRRFFKNLNEKELSPYDFLPIIVMTVSISLGFASFDYLEYFDVIFPLTLGLLLLIWIYFGGFFYLFGFIFKSRTGLLKTLRFTQYLFLPVFVFFIVLFGVYSVFGPEIVWFYIIRSLIYSPPLIIALILASVLVAWILIMGLIGITTTQIAWWKGIIVLIVPIVVLIPIIYFIFDNYFTDIFLLLNNYFDLINSVFNSAETSAAQFF